VDKRLPALSHGNRQKVQLIAAFASRAELLILDEPTGADLRGLPQTLIVNSEYDRLRASGEAFADALAGSGVAVECVREPRTLHGHLNTIGLAGAEASLERIAVFVESLRA
jgi:acetyl esterase/lipase